MSHLVKFGSGVKLLVKVIPRSSRSLISGLHDGRLRVKLNAPPVDGAANKELVKLVSKTLDVRKSSISISSGKSSRRKTLEIMDITLEEANKRIAAHL
ncbi:MAG: YggU family protein [Pyrinomonadaceae bacterium]|nr:YggU family protein [Pyrinomonadaceae bacterium]